MSDDIKQAAEKRRAAHEDPHRAEILSALEVERRGYVHRGLKDRAAEVDAYAAQIRGDQQQAPAAAAPTQTEARAARKPRRA